MARLSLRDVRDAQPRLGLGFADVFALHALGDDARSRGATAPERRSRAPRERTIRRAAIARANYGATCRCGIRSLLSREYEVDPHDTLALVKAKAAFRAVEESDAYARGACPAISYQRPDGRADQLKTLETDSNGVKAALLLYAATHQKQYLDVAERRYGAIRRYFLDSQLPLYSVYVFDDGHRCVQVPHRFFASVNGNMIWNGERLYRVTGRLQYRTDALMTAQGVARYLSDGAGVFSDLQAENDLAEPLIEAMLVLATQEHETFARRWLLTSAAAAYSSRKGDGTYGRFFDGPPPEGIVTAWQTNGGLATEIAAAALAPGDVVHADAWHGARFVPYAVDSVAGDRARPRLGHRAYRHARRNLLRAGSRAHLGRRRRNRQLRRHVAE